MVTTALSKVMTKIFGSRNERLIKTYRRRVEAINSMEPTVRKMTDGQMRARAGVLAQQLGSGEVKDADVLPEAFAIMREAMDRQIGLHNVFNPQFEFDSNVFPTQQLKDLYTDIKFKAMQSGEHGWRTESIPVEMYEAIRAAVTED